MARPLLCCLLVAALAVGCASKEQQAASPPFARSHDQAKRTLGHTQVLLAFKALRDGRFTHPQVTIWRNGMKRFRDRPPASKESDRDYRGVGRSLSSSFFLRDLNGDGEPEVILMLGSGGFFCCDWWRVYGYDAARRRYVVSHFWAEGLPTVADLRDGKVFVSVDQRFHDVFGPGTAPNPIQIWVFRRGRFRDVTRRYPRLIEHEASATWRAYVRYRSNGPIVAQAELPVWAAAEYLLGHRQRVQRTLQRLRRQGRLAATDRQAVVFINDLTGFLRATGYARQ